MQMPPYTHTYTPLEIYYRENTFRPRYPRGKGNFRNKHEYLGRQ